MLTAKKKRKHKVLTRAGSRVGVVVSDIHGQSGRAMIKGILEGQAPYEVLNLASRRLKASREELHDALQGESVSYTHLADHLRRDAFLYVRQSSLRQVLENTESTKRQYALRDRAVSLGWPIERIHIIDSDLGVSGASAEDRDGFQHLVAEVANGHAGICLLYTSRCV